MSLPVFRRFAIQDIPNAPDWMATVLQPLNVFCETTVSALNKNLVVGQNVQGQKYSVSFSTGAAGFPPITFQYTGGGQPDCCFLGKLTDSSGTAPAGPVVVSNWELNINVNPALVTITSITGLSPNTRYNATFLVI